MQVATTIILLTSFLTGINPSLGTSYIAACQVDTATNRSIVEDFLSKPFWSHERTETNTGHLTIPQITPLSDTNDSTACTSFNTTYQEALDEKNGLGEQAYNLTYYKAGSFYFVVITIRQSDTPNYVTSGINYIHIYDQSQDLVEAYAF